MQEKFTIICDTREQNPFFTFGELVEHRKLDAGDYSILGLEDKIRVERKASIGEIYGNLATKVAKDRFYREMEKLAMIEHKCIMVECPEFYLETFPLNSGIPKSRHKFIKIGSKYLKKMIHEVEETFGVPFLYHADRPTAEKACFSFLLNFYNAYVKESDA